MTDGSWHDGSTGLLSKVPLAGDVLLSTAGAAIHSAAIDEHKRILYVSLTRARDLIVLARAQKDPNGEWMETIGLRPRLPADGATIDVIRPHQHTVPAQSA